MNTVQDSINGIAAVEDKLLREQRFLNAVNFESAVTPQVLAANADNYNPPQLRGCVVLRLSASTPVNITGLATGRKGRFLVVENIGANAITLKNLSASSRAENQFNMGGDATIAALSAVILLYDATAKTWVLLTSTSGVAGGDLTGLYPNPTIAAGAVSLAKEANNARVQGNLLINGGFDVNQRQANSLTAITGLVLGTDKYCVDRWKLCSGGNGASTLRSDTNGALEAGLNARWYEFIRKDTSNHKLMAYQVIESVNTFPLANRTVTLQCKLKNVTWTSANKVIRLGLIQLNSTGTIDTIPVSMFPITEGTATNDPTLDTKFTYVAPTSVPTGANGAVRGNAIDCTTTTAWQLFGGVFTVPSNAKNLIFAVWTDDVMTALDSFAIGEAGLYDGAAIRDWLPLPYPQELARCQWYFEKLNGPTNSQIGSGFSSTTSVARCFIPFRCLKRTTPTVALSAVGDVNILRQGAFQLTGAAGTVLELASPNGTGISVTTAATQVAGEGVMVLWTNTTGSITADADF